MDFFLFICLSLLFEAVKRTTTVDGRNPKQPPGMVLKPCEKWDNHHPWWLAGFLNHQQ